MQKIVNIGSKDSAVNLDSFLTFTNKVKFPIKSENPINCGNVAIT